MAKVAKRRLVPTVIWRLALTKITSAKLNALVAATGLRPSGVVSLAIDTYERERSFTEKRRSGTRELDVKTG
jgi:hypothetical protein